MMKYIKVNVPNTIHNGSEVIFLSPCDCSEIIGLSVYYPKEDGEEESQKFVFKDAHGYELSDVDNLFTANVYVKVILNVTDGIAYIQNADTNKYLEGRFGGLEKTNIKPITQKEYDELGDSVNSDGVFYVITDKEDIDIRFVTQAEYDALGDEVADDGIFYVITDAKMDDFDLSNVAYDNSISGLKATNMQDAVDEIAQAFTDGCNKLVADVTAYGVTPDSNSPDDIIKAYAELIGSGGSFSDLTLVNTLTSESYTENTKDITETMELDVGEYLIFVVRSNGGTDSRGMVSSGEITITGADSVVKYGEKVFYVTISETKTITLTAIASGTNSSLSGKMYAYVYTGVKLGNPDDGGSAEVRGFGGSFEFTGGTISTGSSGYGDFTIQHDWGFVPTGLFILFPYIEAMNTGAHQTNITVTNLAKLTDKESDKFSAQLINVTENGCTLRVTGHTSNTVKANSGTVYWSAY